MKEDLVILLRFVWKFGMVYGVRLYLQFKLKKVSNISIPNVEAVITLRKNTSDLQAFYQVFLNDEYNIDFIKKPKVIIDGGANIGLFSLMMKEKFPESKIVCVEPDSDNFQLLKKNLSNYENISFENCGLWNKSVMLKVFDKYDTGKWGMVVEEDEEGGNVPAISINQIVRKYAIDTIDVLKLDIETSEKNLFLKNYESWLPKTKMIIIELHDWMEEDCSRPFFLAINKTIKKYRFFSCGENTIIINNDIS